ncbi:LPXTG cell wall anchor domain-containing protein [Klebsiella sp. P1CD1]|nr:LPXTG cell wall anchor domain-containing protein [Klebsiella sp. P1CD1]
MPHEILSSAATMFIAGGAILAVTLIVALKRKK